MPPVTIYVVLTNDFTISISPTVHFSVLDAPTNLFTQTCVTPQPGFPSGEEGIGGYCSSCCAGESFPHLKSNKVSWNGVGICLTNSLYGRQTDLANKDFHL